ncbi:calcium-binding protein [Herbaspirillum rubrisubalbicans]|uniref:calcium-binding protein n=1 Tax=Herbaspirillum rubrisubalbicans TaxID=80842 RepID=UPI000DD35217|nr:calcium-binding protein [Herbaspirillum rubrisubalbicans]
MSQPQVLNEEDIAAYARKILNGNTNHERISAVIDVYRQLYDQGYSYAGWALGVAKGNTVTGTAALDYLMGTALMGLGNDRVCRNLTPTEIDKIRVDMAIETLAQMRMQARDNGGTLRSDLNFMQVRAAHENAFKSSGLSLDNWTLHVPMSLYRKTHGDEATERLWTRIRDTGGDGLDGLMVSTQLTAEMGRLAFESRDPAIRAEALAWMEKVPGTLNAAALWRSTKLIGKWLGVSVDSIGDFSQPAIADAPQQLKSDQRLLEGIVQRLAAQAVTHDNLTPGLDSPSRNSAALIIKPALHVTQFREGGTVDDLWLVEKNAGRYQGSRSQFRSDFVASNGGVDGKTLLVQQGQAYFVPERSADGTTTYHYSNGAVVVNNTVTGEYRMVVPNTDGSGGQTVYTRNAGADGYTVRQVSTDAAGKIVYEQQSQQATRDAELIPVKTVSVIGGQTTSRDWFSDAGYQTDTYRAGSSSPSSSAIKLGKVSYDLFNPGQRNDAEYQLSALHDAGRLSQRYWLDFSSLSSRWLLGAGTGLGFKAVGELGLMLPAAWSDPIGAFYDSQSSSYDRSASIATATVRAMSATGQALSASQLAALDRNGDGQISIAEAASLRLWADVNEDGQLGSGELLTVTQAIGSAQYGLLTRSSGTVVASATTISAPPAHVRDEPVYGGVPFSNHQDLRRKMQIYPMFQGIFLWKANEIMLGWNRNAYDHMIGTEGDDRFDVNYFAAAPAYLSRYTGRVKYFMAGAGNDVMGGSDRPDTLWGGTGHDTLYGYAGADLLYGEEGDDTVLGQDGNDQLDGGTGNDLLFGGIGDDVLWGGEGNDELQGNEGNDALMGQAGNDRLYGHTGNDTLWGGEGADDLQGNEGDDTLVGGAGNDRLFGQVGNDLLMGGEGDDILVGFTASNEARQSLAAGEADDDILQGGAGNDNLYGGPGNDQLTGEAGRDLLLGEDGHDRLWGGSEDDELQGGAGNDQLDGGSGDDKLFGQLGNDSLWGGQGNDLLMGFTASNEAKQNLLAGETDDDVLYGGAGSDVLIGGVGLDQLYGGNDRDELQGGAGDDMLMGEEGNDNLFGQAGNDTLYGGQGDDYLQGFTASNESQQSLGLGETDDDFLYGGAGADILVGAVGNDYLDGGAGADHMIGGKGDDVYIVNSVNDAVYEQEGEGYDTVITNSNYLLNAHVEELRLLEGFRIHATGNALDNKLIGNSADNILDGVTGADLMLGGAGDDTYYVDDAGDVVSERAGEGRDVVQSSISYRLGAQVEELLLLDFSKAEKGSVDGRNVLVYGYPKRNELDYMQGDAVENYNGTCALTSIANLLTQTGRPTTEAQVVRLAINNNWTLNNPALPAHQLGGSNVSDQRNILASYGIRHDVVAGYNETGIANLLRSGRGVILAVNAGVLWGEDAYKGSGAINHAVTLTGAVYGESDGALLGFYLADSGRGRVSDMTRFVDIASLRRAADLPDAYAIHTLEPIKYWQENIDATGNELANRIAGNRGNNVLSGLAGDDVISGGAGNDTLIGGAGNDSLDGGSGDDIYRYLAGDGADVIHDAEGNDTLLLGEGILAASVMTSLAAGRLKLHLAGGSVEMEAVAGKLVDRVQFADGTVWHARSDGSGYVQVLSGPLKIIGQVKQGQTLSLTNTATRPETLGKISYRWERSTNGLDWTLIAGASDALLLLGADLIGHKLRATMSFAMEEGRGESLVSAVSETVVRANHAPTGIVRISGEAMSNQTLVGSHTLVDLDGLGSIKWQWLADEQLIAGATGNTFKLTQTHVGKAITLRASYVDAQGWEEQINSVATARVSPALPAILGTAAQDVLQGSEGADWIEGLAGNDTLRGRGGADMLNGGPGDDYLSGGAGSDIYLIERGAGQDVISDADGSSAAAASLDVIRFGADITPNDIKARLSRDGILRLSIAGTSDVVAVRDWFNNDAGHIEQLQFADGTIWDKTMVLARTNISTPENDFLTGTSAADRFAGLQGDDEYMVNHVGDVISEQAFEGIDSVFASVSHTLSDNIESLALTGEAAIDGIGNDGPNRIDGNNANNRLVGGGGNDTLRGGAGADILDGGPDHDWLDGGAGSDTYLFGLGYGEDTINEFDRSADAKTSMDTVILGQGIHSGDLHISRTRLGDLVIAVTGTPDKLTLADWFNSAETAIDQIRFTDGTSWDAQQLTDQSAIATRHDDYLVGTSGADQLEGLIGDDVYVVNHADDVIVERRGEGVDTVLSSVSYTLPAGLEHLELTGSLPIDGRGNASANHILGNWAENILDGGAGDDYLSGGGGGDTYLFGRGYGVDVVDIDDWYGTDSDCIKIGAGVSEQQIWLRRVEDDLELSLFETGDKLSVKEWFTNISKRLDRIELSNGRWLGMDDVQPLVSAMSTFAPPSVGQAVWSASYQAALGAVIAAGWH